MERRRIGASRPQLPKRLCARTASSSHDMQIASTSRRDKSDGHPPPSSSWLQEIQNASYLPPPTAYSPSTKQGEDPLIEQQRQCREKLQALRRVRDRLKFYPTPTTTAGSACKSDHPKKQESGTPSMVITTDQVLSSVISTLDIDHSDNVSIASGSGIEALNGLEMLFFWFFTQEELIRMSSVCRSWKMMARHDLFWEQFLFTPFERYPLRKFLGLEKESIPAIQVYMIFHRLHLAQSPALEEQTRRPVDRRLQYYQLLHHRTGSAHAAVDDEPEREMERLMEPHQRRRYRVSGGRAHENQHRRHHFHGTSSHFTPSEEMPIQSVHLIGVPGETVASEPPDLPMIAHLHLHERLTNVFTHTPPGRANRNDLLNGTLSEVDDHHHRITLGAWLSDQKIVSESTLRCFLSQMLLAIDALERSHIIHTDISLTSILVQDYDEDDDIHDDGVASIQIDESSSDKSSHREHKPPRRLFFQLLCGRNTWYSGYRTTSQPEVSVVPPVPAPEVLMDLPDGDLDRLDLEQFLPMLDEDIEDPIPVTLNRLHHDRFTSTGGMIQALLRCAIAVWSRGRFVDTNSASFLQLLLQYPAEFSNGFRSFIEYAKYELSINSASASKLLRHAYVAATDCACDRSIIPYTQWNTRQFRDVNDYQMQVLEFYEHICRLSTRKTLLTVRPASAGDISEELDDNFDTDIGEDGSVAASMLAFSNEQNGSRFLPELMPRTYLGRLYFQSSMQESRLPREKFVSIVAPSTASSSWVRTLAETQTHTLQRLDLSHVRLPTSVLLKELWNLPRITHLRLPRQILREENLEHFVAALFCSDLLPRLQAMDDNVGQALDRMERSYAMQLDMVTFLLQKNSTCVTQDQQQHLIS